MAPSMKRVLAVLLPALLACCAGACSGGSQEIAVDFPDGAPRYRARLVDGRLYGTYRRWYESGGRAFEGAYVKGKLHGVWRTWHESGALAVRASSRRGLLAGTRVEFDPEGKKLDESRFANGERHGLRSRWLPSGRRVESEWKRGVQVGVERTLDAQGRLVEERVFERGKPVRQVVWHEGGQKAVEIELRGGRREGVVQAWFPDGALRETTTYVMGLRHGPYRRWNAAGEEVEAGEYRADAKDGPWLERLDGGEVVHGEFQAGKRHGPWRKESAEGTLLEEGEYAQDLRVGVWRIWSADGVLDAALSGTYVDGVKGADGDEGETR